MSCEWLDVYLPPLIGIYAFYSACHVMNDVTSGTVGTTGVDGKRGSYVGSVRGLFCASSVTCEQQHLQVHQRAQCCLGYQRSQGIYALGWP